MPSQDKISQWASRMNFNPNTALWALPSLFLLGSIVSSLFHKYIWSICKGFTLAALLSILAVILWNGLLVEEGVRNSASLIGMFMALLISFLGWIVTHFSHHYLDGENNQTRYVSALLFTLFSVSVVVITDNLAVLVAGWAASSLGLHQLLTFYGDRPAAQIVAHKKFLVSRFAEICLLLALILIYFEVGSLSFESITSYVSNLELTSLPLTIATVLISMAVILKSAQLPLHGWLIQVMEAPTPVSALLHAGIVNIGGFVVIRLSELFSATPLAQTLLVLFGSLTALLAGLVMMTRISIKVRLAWSTCAQMGFMLMECGLGLYELAFLHLVAHSLYKAYAFLSAGDTVIETRKSKLIFNKEKQSGPIVLLGNLLAFPATFILVTLVVFVNGAIFGGIQIPVIALFLLSIGLASLLWSKPTFQISNLWKNILYIIGLSQIYIIWHLLFFQIVPQEITESHSLVYWAGLIIIALYVLQTWITAYPKGKLATTFYPWAYGGFYLDELFTRITFRVWPVKNSSYFSNSSTNVLHHSSGEHV